MQFNSRSFGEVRRALVESLFVASHKEVHSIPPVGAYHLLDDSGAALLDDSDAFLITPN